MKIQKRWIGLLGVVAVFLGSISVVRASAPYESEVRSIDREVLSIDKQMETFTQTSPDDCKEPPCEQVISYWDHPGRIRKVIETVKGENSPGAILARFYRNCRLIQVRITPNQETPSGQASVERYYFQKGKLIRILFGEQIQTLGKEQTGYLERTLHVEPKACSAPR